MGVSGGEEGAQYRPSLMSGGSFEAYKYITFSLRLQLRFRDSGLCVTYIGKGRPGNFVKMVHNGIEYGDMQLIAEAYDLLKSVGKLLNEELQSVFSEWNKGELLDNRGDGYLVDKVLDKTGMKGTKFAKEIIDRQSTWRRVRLAIISGISTPTMLASLAYFDTYRRQVHS
ncbi:hypothetical protein Godav_017250 [Gossypium davidsonii]|uniref:phosphogluconate dehydrogenase (NADP(+)-dependent, decarboxylating) n=1 Tax=Gossypium davidsonii TaxID=34287 RepID=A0A7J8QSQ9_GOSDV|nr:hypothetical protein [Gossypium davidsonii]